MIYGARILVEVMLPEWLHNTTNQIDLVDIGFSCPNCMTRKCT